MGDDNVSSSEHFTVVSSSGQATGQLTEILSSSQVAVLSNIASSSNILGPNTSASLNTYVTSGNIIPACSTVTLSTLNNLTSSSNTISYHPSLSFHPTLGNPTVAYQTLVPHPNFVTHPNITSYSNLSCQSPVTTHPRPNSLPPPPSLTVLPSHATVMPFNTPTIVNTGPDLTMSVAQAPMLQVLHHQEQLNCHLAVNVQSLVSHSQQNASMKHSEMELITSASTSWTSENVATASKQLSPKEKARPNQQVKNSNSNLLEDVSSECFICSSAVTVAAVSLSAVMPHSHAPLLVLLADVLGYVLTSPHTLHSKVVCSSCYRLLEVIDEVQNTQTKNKADVRRRFQLTVASKHLSYARSQQTGSRWLCRRCGVVSLSQGGPRKRAALATHRGRKRSLRWTGSGKGRLSRTKDPVRQSKGEAHGAKEAKEVRRPADVRETVTVEPDIHVEDLTKLKCKTNSSIAIVEQHSSSSVNKLASVHTNGTCPASNDHPPAAPLPTAAPPSLGNALLPIFDNDPALFAAEERLKVGVMRRAFLSRQCRYQCHYCSHACESAVTLKMHVRVVHMPLLVYDADEGHMANGNASGSNDAEEGLEGGKFRLRMGVRLQNVSTDPLSVKPFVCLFCESAYKLESSLQSHYRDQHSPRKPFQCPRCPENFRRNLELTRHRLYRCPERAKGTKKLKKQ